MEQQECQGTKDIMPDNGMVERFNGRIVSEVLDINTYSHDALEQLLRGFNAAYNARRQRVLNAKTPNQVIAKRLQFDHDAQTRGHPDKPVRCHQSSRHR